MRLEERSHIRLCEHSALESLLPNVDLVSQKKGGSRRIQQAKCGWQAEIQAPSTVSAGGKFLP